MPPRPGPASSIRLALSGEYNGATWANILWVQAVTDGVPSTDDVSTLAEDVSTAWQGHLATGLSEDVTLTLVDAVYFGDPGITVRGEWSGAKVGGEGPGGTPANVALTISWAIDAYYRGGHPRTYLLGIPTSLLHDARTITSAAAVSYQSSGEGFMDAVNGFAAVSILSVTLGTVSFVDGGELRDPPIFRGFTGARTHERLDTQRRRLGRES